MNCKMCNKKLSHKKYSLCNSCSKLGMKNNWKYDDAISVVGHKLYPLYRSIVHQATMSRCDDTEEMVRHLLRHHTVDELSKTLMRQDTDKPISPTNYRLVTTRLRGLAKKQSKPSGSQYIGVATKLDKQGVRRYWGTLNGKYIKGSSNTDEYKTAIARDDHIINLGLEEDYRLNFNG